MARGPAFDSLVDQATQHPVWVLYGDNQATRDDAAESLAQRVAPAPTPFNAATYVAGETDLKEVLDAARTQAMLSPHRWILLKHVHRLKKPDFEALGVYAESPNPSTILCCTANKLDQRLSATKKLLKHSKAFAFASLKPKELPNWLVNEGKKLGHQLSPPAAMLMVELVGHDSAQLRRMLEVVSLYVGNTGRKIETDDVESVISATRSKSVFELTKAMGQGQFGKAANLVDELLRGGEAGLLVLAMLARHVRQLLLAQEGQEQGLRGGDLARLVGVPPFAVSEIADQAQCFSAQTLRGALSLMAQTDARIKSSRIPSGLVLHEAVQFLATPSRTP